MANEVSICNLALYRAGSSVRITSIDESVERTEPVRQCATLYPLNRDAILESAPWGCARKAIALAPLTSVTYPGWPYVYQYPEDCVHAVAICDAGGRRASNVWLSWWGLDTGFVAPKIPYEIATSDDGAKRVILTDIPNAWLYYIFRQTITNTYSPLMVDAFGWKLGSDLASALNANANRVTRCIQMYEPTLNRALAQMLNEAQQDREQDSPSIMARMW